MGPHRSWLMSMRWHDLLFMHWPVRPDVLRPHIPAGLELDTYEGEAWIGVVPFGMRRVRPRFVPPLPWISAFPELNVRTHRGAPPAEFKARYWPTGQVAHAAPGSLDDFLTNRLCLYAVDKNARIYRGDIAHPPWPMRRTVSQPSLPRSPADGPDRRHQQVGHFVRHRVRRGRAGRAAQVERVPRPLHRTVARGAAGQVAVERQSLSIRQFTPQERPQVPAHIPTRHHDSQLRLRET